jgi:hypothetical protein
MLGAAPSAACTLLTPLSGLTGGPASGAEDAASDGDGTASDGAVEATPAADDAASPDGADGGCPCSLFGAGVPSVLNDVDTRGVEVGLRFFADVAGYVTVIRYYRGPLNAGPHAGSLWTDDGARLASVAFAAETTSGWQTASLSPPAAVEPGVVYVVSYHAPAGRYSATGSFFSRAHDAPPLHAPARGTGRFSYGSTSTFPTGTFNATHYWVDVVFVPR